MTALSDAFTHAVMITAFVATMMITVEYVSVLSQGAFQRWLTGSKWTQYVGAVLLGTLPGCLGPFMVVTLYAHRVLPFGAVVGAMIATSGDESFVMLGLFPVTALWLTIALAVVGLLAGPLVDLLLGERWAGAACFDLLVHPENACRCFPGREIVTQWERVSGARLLLTLFLGTYVTAIAVGAVGPSAWSWVRVTLLSAGAFCTFVVATVPDHFLTEHLWKHVALRHVPRVFLWTFGVMAVVAWLDTLVDLAGFVQGNRWAVLVTAVLLGIIPESGPHLVFVTLFSEGVIPVSILAASSISQDGHGMLPLLAESRSDFVRVKAINVVVALALGAIALVMGV